MKFFVLRVTNVCDKRCETCCSAMPAHSGLGRAASDRYYEAKYAAFGSRREQCSYCTHFVHG
jgi:hypothetical protein